MNRTRVGVTAISLGLAAASFGGISIATLTARAHAQAQIRDAQTRAPQTRDASPRSKAPAPIRASSPTSTPSAPLATSAPSRQRPASPGPIRRASAAGPWSPSSALPSSRDVDSILPESDTFTTHGTGTRPPPPLGRTWDPNRETYAQWYARVIAGTAADPSTFPTSGPNPNNSSTANPPSSGTNQWGEWAFADDVSVVGRVFLPNGSPGAGFAVYIVPVFLTPPFPFPIIRTYTDAQGFFYADLWASGVWSIAVTKDTPSTEPRTVYFTSTYDRMFAGDEPNTIIMQSRLGGGRR